MRTPGSVGATPTPLPRGADGLALDDEGRVECLLGNEAIVRGALEAGVAFASGYPGTPSSEVTDSLARIAHERDIRFEYSVNEKVALEMAFAASLAGARSICAMKHAGLLVASDPLATIPYMGVSAGMVIVSAGDPSCRTSSNEQDQRHLGRMLHLPVLDPSTPAEAHAMAREAFELSEASRLPVLLRITTRVAHSSAPVRFGPLTQPRVAGFVRDPKRLVPIPANARRLRREIPGRLEVARDWMARAGLFRRSGAGRRAVLATGAPAATCADLLAELELENELLLVQLGGVYPAPTERLLELLREVDEVLVVEELSPFLEDLVRSLCAEHRLGVSILGKRTGHLPEEFEYEPEVIQRGLHAAFGCGPEPVDPPTYESLPQRPPILCAGCPHRSTYFAARAAFASDQLYFNDIGCYTLGYGPPLHTADALLCMGAGFTLAAGVSRVTGQRTVGFLGDSTFFHAGMPALLNAIKEDVGMVAVVLDNQVTAMTGFQESPTISHDGAVSERRVSIEGVVRALGAQHVETIDPNDLPTSIAAFERARDAQGLSVIVAQGPCPVDVGRRTGARSEATYVIDHEHCRSCGRESCGVRCQQCVSEGLERQMSRTRALECGAQGPRAVVAACTTECPLGLCVQGYAGHIAAGQFREAVELIMSRCPLPDSVCRVCHRPCETACVRNAVDEPVAINDLKRFAMDWAASQPTAPYDPQRDPPSGRSVAVIGAGPAGLAAAHDLRLRGHAVTLFDAGEEPGGLLRTGIPAFRLPRTVLRRDVERILDLGVSFCGNTVLGRDVELSNLLADGFDAVFLALGAHRPRPLAVPGEQGEGAPTVVDALGYLRAVARDEEVPHGRRVVVVGGGNAAVDAARTARRLGADRVTVAYRRAREEMPALADEIVAAEHEGVELRTRLAPLSMQRTTVPGLLCIRTEPGEADEAGRRRPLAVAGSELLLEADLVIVAAGQEAELGFAQSGDILLDLDGEGGLRIEAETCATSHPAIFAGGDATAGSRTVTDAIAAGQRAAWGIDCALRGAEAADHRPPPPRSADWPRAPDELSRPLQGRGHRIRPTELTPELATTGFGEVAGTLSETQARAEAARCAVCGECGNCRACLDLFGCPAFFEEGGLIHIDSALCTDCGVCADFCPNGAIHRIADSEI